MNKLSIADIRAFADDLGFSIPDTELGEYAALAADQLDGLAAYFGEPTDAQLVRHVAPTRKRDRGAAPQPGRDPLNAIIRTCDVVGALEGPLTGLRIGVKDNIAIAGVPMTGGSRFLADYVPVADSLVVARLLEAGATISAVTNMDSLAYSAGGETSDYGTVVNPFDAMRTAGGSSGGSAAALWYDDIDVCIGSDQGGSIRVPASWCGVLGIKPTYDLVPYYGNMGSDRTLNHAGPMARTVAEMERVLRVIADPLNATEPAESSKVAGESAGLAGLRIGIVLEGVKENLAEGVHEAFLSAVDRFRELGAVVEDVSVPEHLTSGAMIWATFTEGMWDTFTTAGNGLQHKGPYDVDLARAIRRAWDLRRDELPATVKAMAIMGKYLKTVHGGDFYARAQNERISVRRAYDQALRRFDFLMMPTTTSPAFEARPDASLAERVTRGGSTMSNTAVFDMTGHPALSMPAASVNGLPLGVQLVGRHFADFEMLDVARIYEAAYGWEPAGDTALAAARRPSSHRQGFQPDGTLINNKGPVHVD